MRAVLDLGRRLKPTLLEDRKAHDEDGVVVATLVQNRRPEASGTKGKGIIPSGVAFEKGERAFRENLVRHGFTRKE